MNRIKGFLYLTGAFTLAGTSVVSARYVSGKLGTFTITSTSLLFAILILLPFSISNIIKNFKVIKPKTWFILFLQALFGIFLFRIFLLLGLFYTSTGEAGIMTGATPVVTMLLAWLVLKEAIIKKGIFGILFTIGGILLIQGISISGGSFIPGHFFGNMLVLCAAVCESLFNILSRIINIKIKDNHLYSFSPTGQTAIVSGIAFLLCLIPSAMEHPVMSLMAIGIKEWLALSWYGIFVTALAFIFWYQGIKRCPASTAAAFSGMMPFTSLILSVTLLNEPSSLQQWVGGLLVILGMFIIGSSQPQKEI